MQVRQITKDIKVEFNHFLQQRLNTRKHILITLQSILFSFLSSEVAFEKAERGGKTPDVVGKVRQVDGTQAEIKRFEVIAYSLGLSRRIFCRLGLSEQWEKLNISFDDE